jgi:hypothetical protein
MQQSRTQIERLTEFSALTFHRKKTRVSASLVAEKQRG